jgi:hypothetical protein
MPATVQGVGPEVEVNPSLDPRDRPTSRSTGSLEEDDLAACPSDQGGRHQPGQTSTDDDQVRPGIVKVL